MQVSSLRALGLLEPAFFKILSSGRVRIVQNLLCTGGTYKNLNFQQFLLLMCGPQVFRLWVGLVSAKFALDGQADPSLGSLHH